LRISRDSKSRRSNAAADGDRHDHVVFTLSNRVIVTFNDPRRFGVMDLLGDGLASHRSFAAMGPEPLESSFGAVSLAEALAGRRVALKTALLDQRVVAGLGNIYASEALHLAGLSPLRRSSTLTTPARGPNPKAVRLAAAIKTVLREAIARKERP
jgi:formamidopyrimidine-DNA glycosylase